MYKRQPLRFTDNISFALSTKSFSPVPESISSFNEIGVELSCFENTTSAFARFGLGVTFWIMLVCLIKS